MAKTVLVTGASGGIGLELARVFAKNKFTVVLLARSQEKLVQIAQDLEKEFKVKTIVLKEDLTDPLAPSRVFIELKKKSFSVDILVNNAGFGSYGPFTENTEEVHIIQLNILALTSLTKLFLPEIIKNQGKILNVASIASFLPGPYMAVYHASKAYVLSFSEALAGELKDKNVTVTALCPGPTYSGFQERAKMTMTGRYSSLMLDSKKVAEAGYKGLMKNQTIVIPGRRYVLLTWILRFMPQSLIVSIMSRMRRND